MTHSIQSAPRPAGVVLTNPTQVTGIFALLMDQKQRVEGVKTPSALWVSSSKSLSVCELEEAAIRL